MREFKSIYFEIPGVPMAKQRHRMTKGGHSYTPEQTVNYENFVKVCFMAANENKVVYWDNEPLTVHILAMFPIPKSYSKTRRDVCISGRISPSTKDCDNIAKIICDALNGLAYSDDKHINLLVVNKVFTEDLPKVRVLMSSSSLPYGNYVNDVIDETIKVTKKLEEKQDGIII